MWRSIDAEWQKRQSKRQVETPVRNPRADRLRTCRTPFPTQLPAISKLAPGQTKCATTPSFEATDTSCKVKTQVIHGSNGSFVLRYKLWSNSCDRLTLKITDLKTGRHYGQSPYSLKGPLLSEACSCPLSLKNWLLSAAQCGPTATPIKSQVARWPRSSVNVSEMVDEVERRFATRPGAFSICHYAVRNGKLYRKCYGEHVGFNTFSDQILHSLLRKVTLPDMDFFVNLGDWPLERGDGQKHVPILSWCGSETTWDIILPTYDLTEAVLESMGRVSLDIHTVEQMAVKVPFSRKKNTAFFRGRDSSEERLQLVNLSKQNPHLIEARISRFFFFRDGVDDHGGEHGNVPFGKFFEHKYQISMDGTVAAYRLPFLLAGNSLVLKQDSQYFEHFYPSLKPWSHYVPFARDLSDLVLRLQWVMENEKEVLKIIANANQFARNHLQPLNIFCYHVQVLRAYAQLFNSRMPDQYVQKEMEYVRDERALMDCGCDERKAKAGRKEEL